jgi:hypothetical protein
VIWGVLLGRFVALSVRKPAPLRRVYVQLIRFS